MNSLTVIGSLSFVKECNKTEFQYCQNSRNKLLYIRAVQGHRGGGKIELDMRWVTFSYPPIGNSFYSTEDARSIRRSYWVQDSYSILQSTKTKLKNKFHGDMTKPRGVHYKTGRKNSQDAVYWIHLGRALEKSITLWQTKSHASSAYSTVPPDCMERVISQHGEVTICQRSSTPRLAPRTVLKDTWHEQQQQ